MGRAINARISTIANAMGLSDFQALSVLNCPAGGCSAAVSEGGDSGDGGESGGGDYKWAIGLAVGVFFIVSAGIALYCFKTRWKRRANRINVARTEKKETVDVEYEVGAPLSNSVELKSKYTIYTVNSLFSSAKNYRSCGVGKNQIILNTIWFVIYHRFLRHLVRIYCINLALKGVYGCVSN
jgi:hypothetical protein